MISRSPLETSRSQVSSNQSPILALKSSLGRSSISFPTHSNTLALIHTPPPSAQAMQKHARVASSSIDIAAASLPATISSSLSADSVDELIDSTDQENNALLPFKIEAEKQLDMLIANAELAMKQHNVLSNTASASTESEMSLLETLPFTSKAEAPLLTRAEERSMRDTILRAHVLMAAAEKGLSEIRSLSCETNSCLSPSSSAISPTLKHLETQLSSLQQQLIDKSEENLQLNEINQLVIAKLFDMETKFAESERVQQQVQRALLQAQDSLCDDRRTNAAMVDNSKALSTLVNDLQEQLAIKNLALRNERQSHALLKAQCDNTIHEHEVISARLNQEQARKQQFLLDHEAVQRKLLESQLEVSMSRQQIVALDAKVKLLSSRGAGRREGWSLVIVFVLCSFLHIFLQRCSMSQSYEFMTV